MACYHPLIAYRSRAGRDPRTGKWPLVFNVTNGYSDMEVKVPCGQCIGCRLERSRQWAIRCVHEASLYDNNCFLTLTYNNDHLRYVIDKSTGEMLPTLHKRDMVLFLKRLRKQFGDGIRFFQCGEYGEETSRPHHHIILFNFDFPDKKLFKMRRGFPVYRSYSLERLWYYGNSEVAGVSFESAAYVARYITKKVFGDAADSHYNGRQPEYTTMSRRPGIGRDWFDKYHTDVYPADQCVIGRNLIARPPKYYDMLFDLKDSDALRSIKFKRTRLAKLSTDNCYDRLAVREQVQLRKAAKLIRPLEAKEMLL